MALQDPVLWPHLFFFLPYFYFWEQGWATCSEGSCGALPTCTTPLFSPLFPCDLRISCTRDQCSLIQGQRCMIIKQEPLSLAPGNEPESDRESGLEYRRISISWAAHDVQENLQLFGMTMKTSSQQRGDSLVKVWWSGRTLEGVYISVRDVRRGGRKCQAANKRLGLESCLENTGNLPCSKSFFRLLKCWKALGSHYWTNCSPL